MWQTVQRNVLVGDVVLIQDANQVRGNWKLGIVSQTFPGDDRKVHSVEVQYKNKKYPLCLTWNRSSRILECLAALHLQRVSHCHCRPHHPHPHHHLLIGC